jgi:hypothetical protein
MGLAPGPFLNVRFLKTAIEPGVYDFTDDALTLQGELDAIAAEWQPVVDWLTVAATGSGDIDPLGELDGVLLDIAPTGRGPTSVLSGDVLTGMVSASAALDAAIAFAPVQAWSDPGAPYVPPDSALTLVVPQLPPGAFIIAPNLTVSGFTQGGPPSISLDNTTRFGAPNFTVGDQFRLLATGKPGQRLTVVSTLNGKPWPFGDYGPLPADGQLELDGTMGPDAVGAWSQQWFIGDQLLASFNFLVTPGGS